MHICTAGISTLIAYHFLCGCGSSSVSEFVVQVQPPQMCFLFSLLSVSAACFSELERRSLCVFTFRAKDLSVP